MKRWHWFVYIVECQDRTYYTGVTWNLNIRTEQHRFGLGSRYTARHGFKQLVYTEEFNDIHEARARERQIRNWSQAKKKRLISGRLFDKSR